MSMELMKVAQLSVMLPLNPLSKACGRGLVPVSSAAAMELDDLVGASVAVVSLVEDVLVKVVDFSVSLLEVFVSFLVEDVVASERSSPPTCRFRRSLTTLASLHSGCELGTGGGERSTRMGPDCARRVSSAAILGTACTGLDGVSTICSGM